MYTVNYTLTHDVNPQHVQFAREAGMGVDDLEAFMKDDAVEDEKNPDEKKPEKQSQLSVNSENSWFHSISFSITL